MHCCSFVVDYNKLQRNYKPYYVELLHMCTHVMYIYELVCVSRCANVYMYRWHHVQCPPPPTYPHMMYSTPYISKLVGTPASTVNATSRAIQQVRNRLINVAQTREILRQNANTVYCRVNEHCKHCTQHPPQHHHHRHPPSPPRPVTHQPSL